MGDMRTSGTGGLKSRAGFAALIALATAAAAAHAAGLARIHHLPFIEGLPGEFHPRVLVTAAVTLAAVLLFTLALAWLIPSDRELLWRRLGYSLAFILVPVGAFLANRSMTELMEGASTPGWNRIAAWSSVIGVGGFLVFSVFDRMDASGTVSRVLFVCLAAIVAVGSCFFSLNSALTMFEQFGPSLQFTIGSAAFLALAVGALILKRDAPHWSLGAGSLFAGLLGVSLPWVLGSRDRGAAVAPPDDSKPKHVILITVDTLRADVLSCYGGPDAAPTPNLDALAQDSIQFMKGTTFAPWTLPSMASLFTGEDPRVHQCVNWGRRLPDRFKTPAEFFAEAGYHTQAVVHNAFLRPQHRFDRGFANYNYVEMIELGFELNPLRRSPLLRTRRYNFSSTSLMITVNTIRYLRRMGRARPFFLWVHFFDPHQPYLPPDRYLDASAEISGGEALKSFGRRSPEEEQIHARTQKARYKGEVRYVDECVGRIIHELKRQGVYDSALIVLTSDHGEEFYEHGGYGHSHTLYEELLHVPLLWKAPGNSRAGTRVETRVPMAGIRAAMLETMGFNEADAAAKAPSILRFVGDGGDPPKPPVILGGTIDPSLDGAKSVIAGEWKLIEWEGEKPPEIFDLGEDQAETQNLFPTHEKERNDLQLLLSLHEGMQDKRGEELRVTPEDATLELDEESRNELRNLGYLK